MGKTGKKPSDGNSRRVNRNVNTGSEEKNTTINNVLEQLLPYWSLYFDAPVSFENKMTELTISESLRGLFLDQYQQFTQEKTEMEEQVQDLEKIIQQTNDRLAKNTTIPIRDTTVKPTTNLKHLKEKCSKLSESVSQIFDTINNDIECMNKYITDFAMGPNDVKAKNDKKQAAAVKSDSLSKQISYGKLQTLAKDIDQFITRNTDVQQKQLDKNLNELKLESNVNLKSLNQILEKMTEQNGKKSTPTREDGDVVKLKMQIEDLTTRLSSEMSAQLGKNETSLENVSILNRPMNIADEYQHFCSNIWLDAKQALDDHEEYTEKEKSNFLMSVLKISLEKANKIQEDVWQKLNTPVNDLYEIVTDPINLKKHKNVQANSTTNKFKLQLHQILGDHLRINASTVNLDHMEQELKKGLLKDTNSPKMIKVNLKSGNILKYINASLRLTWKMVIQKPRMKFGYPGLGKNFQKMDEIELSWNSKPENKNAILQYYIHPVLYHGDKVMAKGKALVE